MSADDKTPERLVIERVGETSPPAELPRAGVLTIGSSDDAGLVVSGQGVADMHCAIGRTKGGGWALKDLGSDFGTRVNGKSIQTVRLRAGDQILIGSRRLRVVDPSQRPEQAPPEQAPDAPASSPASAAPAAAPAKSRTAPEGGDLPPETTTLPRIEGYRLVRRLGRGGMGQVLLAIQERLDREVALKVLSSKIAADPAFVRRFEAEARSAAALNHPNVVHVYDVGEGGGVHYLSMEYMDAGNLEERVAKQGPLPWRQAVRVLKDAAAGLVYAESKGIVHRDIKPANLMQNHTGVTKIADLGLATHVDAESAQGGTNKVLGTPHFMSPEQVRGERLDSRADLYALGATAYRLLSGTTPFEGESSREILRAHLRDEPVPLAEIQTDVPPAFSELVQHLMRKDPADRPGSASALLAELERLEEGRGAAAPIGRRRRSPVLPVVVVVAAVGAGAWFFLGSRGGDEPRAEGTSVASTDSGPTISAPEPADPGSDPASAPGDASTSADAPAPDDVDDDTQLKLREAEARVAYLELQNRDMGLEERRDELRDLATRFRGTTTASEALDRAERLDRQVTRLADSERQRTAAVSGTVQALTTAASFEGTPRTAVLLTAIAAVPISAELADDTAFQTRKREIEQSVIDGAVERVRAELARSDAAIQAGDFEAAVGALEGLTPAFALPSDVDQRGLARVELLRTLGRQVTHRLSGLEDEHAAWLVELERRDARALAAAFSGPTGLEEELRALDLASAAERLAGSSEWTSASVRAFSTALRDDIERARAVLATLGSEYSTTGWRRHTVTDPRARGAPVQAIGADEAGVLVEASGGAKKIPWSVWGGDTKEVQRLFHDRLERPWTDEERASIAALLRLTAVAEALAVVAPMLVPDGRTNFQEREAREVEAAFENALDWDGPASERERTEREARAGALLCDLLDDASEERWSDAVSGVERLLDSYRDTLFVRLLADGSGFSVGAGDEFVPLSGPKPDGGGEEAATGTGGDEADGARGGDTDDGGAPPAEGGGGEDG